LHLLRRSFRKPDGRVRKQSEIEAVAEPSASLAGLVAHAERLRDNPDLLRCRLRHLRSHPDRLDEVARRSYWHVNGFAKVRLIARGEYCIRLHVWPSGKDRRGDVEPHGHRWDFASWVVVGRGLRETYFTETDSDTSNSQLHVRYDYGRRTNGNGYLKPRGVVRWLRPDPPQERGRNAVYGCSPTLIHTLAPVGCELVATVVLQGQPVVESTTVYRPYRHPGFPDLQLPIAPTDLGDLLEAVEAAITIR
jgi:hypothetical protein